MGRTKRLRQRRSNNSIDNNHTIVAELEKYLRLCGWRNTSKLAHRFFEYTGRGLYSKRSLQAGDVLISLPFEMLISLLSIEKDNEFCKFFMGYAKQSEDCKINYQALLSFYVLFHKHHKTTKYKFYLNSLPATFSNAMFCTKNELYFLPENILIDLVMQTNEIKSNYTILKNMFSSICTCCRKPYFPDLFTLEAFKWAYCVVNSRGVYTEPDTLIKMLGKSNFKKYLKDEPTIALAPFLDLFNHSDCAVTTTALKNEDQNYFYEIYTEKEYKKYDQIFINYGNCPNSKLLLDYGFIIANNSHDYFEFSLVDIERLIKKNKSINCEYVHKNKFKFIKVHNLDQQMFVQKAEGISHNLVVSLYLIFKVASFFPNNLSEIAFGAYEELANCVKKEAEYLIEYKINEYNELIKSLSTIKNISGAGIQCLEYMKECINYLEYSLNKFFL